MKTRYKKVLYKLRMINMFAAIEELIPLDRVSFEVKVRYVTLIHLARRSRILWLLVNVFYHCFFVIYTNYATSFL